MIKVEHVRRTQFPRAFAHPSARIERGNLSDENGFRNSAEDEARKRCCLEKGNGASCAYYPRARFWRRLRERRDAVSVGGDSSVCDRERPREHWNQPMPPPPPATQPPSTMPHPLLHHHHHHYLHHHLHHRRRRPNHRFYFYHHYHRRATTIALVTIALLPPPPPSSTLSPSLQSTVYPI